MNRLRAAWSWVRHGPPYEGPDLSAPRPIEEVEQLYPTLVRMGVTPTTGIWEALELLAAELERRG